jgi:hypothetical protein
MDCEWLSRLDCDCDWQIQTVASTTRFDGEGEDFLLVHQSVENYGLF